MMWLRANVKGHLKVFMSVFVGLCAKRRTEVGEVGMPHGVFG